MKALRVLALGFVFAFVLAAPVLAADEHPAPTGEAKVEAKVPQTAIFSGAAIGAGLGAGIVMVGAGWGFGRIGATALESMARQPEVRGNIQTAMIVIAALLEGATFFALLVCLLISQGNKAGF